MADRCLFTARNMRLTEQLNLLQTQHSTRAVPGFSVAQGQWSPTKGGGNKMTEGAKISTEAFFIFIFLNKIK